MAGSIYSMQPAKPHRKEARRTTLRNESIRRTTYFPAFTRTLRRRASWCVSLSGAECRFSGCPMDREAKSHVRGESCYCLLERRLSEAKPGELKARKKQ